MEKIVLPATLREATGKGPARTLRRQGMIPGIIYGKTRKPAQIKVEAKQLKTLLDATGAENVPFQLSVDGAAPITVMLKELQREAISGAPLHADFWELTKGQRLHVDVAIHVKGAAEAAGAAKGGVLQQVMREIPMECLPEDIPEFIEVEVSSLEIGDSIHVRDLKLPAGLKPLADPDQTVVTCAPPTVAKEEAAPAAAEAEAAEGAAPAAKEEAKPKGE